MVLFELLTGKTPFEHEGEDLFRLLERVVTDPAPKTSAQRAGVPAELDAIIARALAKRPEERYARAGELARELRSLAAGPAEADFAPDGEPSAENHAAPENLAKVLADLEAFSRAQEPSNAANELNFQLRKAFHYVQELVRQVIAADPAFAVKLDLIYLGALPAARLGQGRVDLTTRKIGDADVVDCLTFSYRMSSPRQARIALRPEEARFLKRELERAGLRYDSRTVGGNEDKRRFEAFLIDTDIGAKATLRGDYESNAVEIACQNVGVPGPAKYRLSSAEFDTAIWEFGQLLLGRPSRFAGLRLPGAFAT